jgi:hypothetical protein
MVYLRTELYIFKFNYLLAIHIKAKATYKSHGTAVLLFLRATFIFSMIQHLTYFQNSGLS